MTEPMEADPPTVDNLSMHEPEEADAPGAVTPVVDLSYPFFTYDIRYGSKWPQHIVDCLTGDGPEDRGMSIDEVGAVLLHAALVEIGLIPNYINEGPLYEFLSTDLRNIVLKSMQPIPRHQRSDFAMTVTYNAILCGENYCTPPIEDGFLSPVSKSQNVKVLIMYDKEVVSAYASFENPPGTPNRLENFNRTFNFRSFIDPISGLPLNLNTRFRATQWVNIIRLNAWSFSGIVKNEFGIPLIDMLGGYLHEARFRDMPREILVNVFEYLTKKDLQTLKKVSKTVRMMANDVLSKRLQRRRT